MDEACCSAGGRSSNAADRLSVRMKTGIMRLERSADGAARSDANR